MARGYDYAEGQKDPQYRLVQIALTVQGHPDEGRHGDGPEHEHEAWLHAPDLVHVSDVGRSDLIRFETRHLYHGVGAFAQLHQSLEAQDCVKDAQHYPVMK